MPNPTTRRISGATLAAALAAATLAANAPQAIGGGDSVAARPHAQQDACGSDSRSNKGFAYTELNVRGARGHVVGTHTESTDSGCKAGEAVAKRNLPFKQIDAFLDAKYIPASEQVIVAGDFNVDSHSSEYASMPADAGPTAADARTGHAKPAGWTNEVVKEQSAPWTVTSWGTSYTYPDLSDHYPLVASAR